MRKILKLGAILAAATLWVSFAHAGTFHHGRYLPDRAGPGCLNSAPRKLSGFLPGYSECGALRF